MKTLILVRISLVCLFFLTINNVYSQSWQGAWGNSGNRWFGSWHIATPDRYHIFPITHNGIRKDNVFSYNWMNGWWMYQGFNTNTNSWETYSSNSDLLGYWKAYRHGSLNWVKITSGSIVIPIYRASPLGIFVAYFDRNSSTRYAGLFEFGGFTFNIHLGSGGNLFFLWEDDFDSKYLSGNFDLSDAQHELLCIKPSEAKIIKFGNGSPSNWSTFWSNGGSGTIGNNGWITRPDDKYWVADITGDGRFELICYNIGTGWASVMKFENGNWIGIWSNGGNGSLGIGGFQMHAGCDLFPSNYDVCGKDEILFINGSNKLASIKNFSTAQIWPTMWTNNSNPPSIGGWNIGNSGDRYLPINNDKLFSVNVINGYAAVQKYVPPIPCNNQELDSHTELGVKTYPNPFNPITKISFELHERTFVTVNVFDYSGRLVSNLISNYLYSGNHNFEFDGTNLASGAYFLTIQAGEYKVTKKLLLIK